MPRTPAEQIDDIAANIESALTGPATMLAAAKLLIEDDNDLPEGDRTITAAARQSLANKIEAADGSWGSIGASLQALANLLPPAEPPAPLEEG